MEWQTGRSGIAMLKAAWENGVNAPATSAAGRLFDAAASLLGLCDHASFEGQGPMLLEAVARGEAKPLPLPLRANTDGLLIADWAPLLQALRDSKTSIAQRAMQFHVSLANCITEVARHMGAGARFDRVGLTGGVFQNKLLAELALRELAAAGYETTLAQHVPCNDGGLAMGQIAEAAFHHE
jgi:hydrogenase maturation protein HypF